jgi:hypothetical protein
MKVTYINDTMIRGVDVTRVWFSPETRGRLVVKKKKPL